MSIKAFTLSEVLLVLSVIGVVAALTIPNLIQNMGDTSNRVAWKKHFSKIVQTTSMLQSSYGGIDFSTDNSMRESYSQVIAFIKQGATPNIFLPKYIWYKNTFDAGEDFSVLTDAAAVLNDGAFIKFTSYKTDCNTTRGTLSGLCGYVYVDVNGQKAPNMHGVDLFQAWVLRKENSYLAFPIGANGDGKTCIPNSATWNTSDGCAAAALQNGPMP